MLVSQNWLSTHIDLEGLDHSNIDDLLTYAGVEVEAIHHRGVRDDRIVVSQIKSAEAHPDAKRLKVCMVDVGDEKPRQIVCGATNYAVGDKVPCALPGTILPGDFEIKIGKLRGVESQGMLCSGAELEISDDGQGLLILPPDSQVGQPLSEITPSDTLYEIEVTPNRPDLLSHHGLARELAALSRRPLISRLPDASQATSRKAGVSEIALEAVDLCPHYSAHIIRGVKIGPSPAWLCQRLESIGLRPINNVVDITNFVLHECGHPLHAFDLAMVADERIVVRKAGEGESFTALDGEKVTLAAGDGIIADGDKALAIAGVIGGEYSGVGEKTTDILLESAWFSPQHIRRTARRLGITTDSSYRFERGTDPQNVLVASQLAIRLIGELAGGKADSETLIAGAPPQLTGSIAFDNDFARNYLGGHIPEGEQSAILERLGLRRESDGKWVVPSYRLDLQRPVDLIEEVARVHGIANAPARISGEPAAVSSVDEAYDFQFDLARQLAAFGLFEARTIKLISRQQLQDVPYADARPVALKNPISDEHTLLRPSLLPGLLAVLAHNISHGQERLAFFEAGTVFQENPDATNGVSERPALAIVLAGAAEERSWTANRPRPCDLADLRGLIDALLPGVRLKIKPSSHPCCILSAELAVGKKHRLGFFGQLKPARARSLDCDGPVYVAELSLETLQAIAASQPRRFRPLPKFPAITRDIAMEVEADLPANRVESVLTSVNEPLLERWLLFDVFRDPSGEKLPADRKSLAWSLTYRHPERTLKSEEVDEAHGNIREQLRKQLSVQFR